ncbi:MAG: phosphate/phosphite/phosphonate ABC transporter substrate-binding protein [Acidimicrobiaceae bacterium]|nr:phosphate/phosphite/phosphonate ABC transporter substrate-binding protein [Acidimicrobiaceae bacterium]
MSTRGRATTLLALVALAAALAGGCGSSGASGASGNGKCPNGGTVRWGVEPYDDAAQLEPMYKPLAEQISKKLGCNVQLTIANDYTAEVEAMRNKKLEFGEFGPLGYLLAHKEANAQAIAAFGDSTRKPATYYASIVTWNGSGIHTLADCKGKTFGFSDPASTSGHLEPAYGLKSHGIDPDKDVHAIYSGSHTASYEALRNHKTDCNELNSQTIATATSAGEYKASDYTVLWKSDQIPLDPIAIRGDLDNAFRTKLVNALTSVDFSQLSPDIQKKLKDAISGSTVVPQTDSAFDGIRQLVSVLHLDLSKTQG